MYKLSEKTKRNLSKNIGIPYEILIKMDDDEILSYIEKKNGKKIKYSKSNHKHISSEDDSTLINSGKYRTMEDVEKVLDNVLNSNKGNKQLTTHIANDDEVIDNTL